MLYHLLQPPNYVQSTSASSSICKSSPIKFCIRGTFNYHISLFLEVRLCSQYVDIGAASQEKQMFAYAKTKPQINCAVTAQLISAFVFATRIAQFLFFLSFKPLSKTVHASLCKAWSETRRPGFSRRGSLRCIFCPRVLFRSWDILESKIAKKKHLLLVKTMTKCGINLSYMCKHCITVSSKHNA